MYKLFNVLRAIFLGQRAGSATDIETERLKTRAPESNKEPIEPPPPEMIDGYDLSGDHSPSRDGYDPLRETTAISTPFDEKFFNLYCASEGTEFLKEHCSFELTGLEYKAVKAAGAATEFEILFKYLRHNPEHYLFRIYQVKGYLVLCANNAFNENYKWYYSTSLELPEGRFNPIIMTVQKPTGSKKKKQLEYWADHSKASKGERG